MKPGQQLFLLFGDSRPLLRKSKGYDHLQLLWHPQIF